MVTFCSQWLIMQGYMSKLTKSNKQFSSYYKILKFKCICTMNLTFELVGQSHILISMDDYIRIHVKFNFLGPIVCKMSRFKSICNVTLTFELDSQGHILFPIVDTVEFKMNSLRPRVCELLCFKSICSKTLTLNLEDEGDILFPVFDFVDAHVKPKM